MKKYVLAAVLSLVCIGLVTSCTCPKGKTSKCSPAKCQPAKQAAVSVDQCPVLSKLNLTAAQKAEVQKLMDQCEPLRGTKKGCAQMKKGLKKILTQEQMAQFNAACKEMKKSAGCKSAGKMKCPSTENKDGSSTQQTSEAGSTK